MQIRIIGARALNPIGSSRIRKYASAQLIHGRTALQIDAGNPVRGRPSAVLLSHMHRDHTAGLRNAHGGTQVLVPHAEFAERLKRCAGLQIRVFKSSCRVGDFRVRAFRVDHSRHTPTYGFRIGWHGRQVLWLSDFRRLKGALSYFKNLDMLFLGASSFSRNISHRPPYRTGHMAAMKSLAVLRNNRIRPKKIVLMHIGRSMMPIEEKMKVLRQAFPKFDLDYAWDGRVFQLKERGR